jgi:FemAB-related protein (PEP-CTERM system-associated)
MIDKIDAEIARGNLSTDSGRADVRVRLATEADLRAWQRFVDRTPQAGCMHHAGWYAVLRDACWVKPYFLVAEDVRSGDVAGILPLYHSKSPFTGSHLSSLEDGVLAEDRWTVAALLGHARTLRDSIGARYLQVRGGPLDHPGDKAFATVRTLINTSQRAEVLWSAIKKKTRWAIRQAERAPIRVERDTTFAGFEDFYWTYAEHMRALGTPVVGIGFFRAMRTRLGTQRLRLYAVRERQRLIGGMLCILNSAHWTDYYAIVRPTRETDFANYLLYWHVIRDASIAGTPVLDLGRSAPDSNVQLFKRKWGGKGIELAYQYYFNKSRSQNDPGLETLKRDKGFLQHLWAHLPLPLCNTLGPLIRKQLPFI